MLIETATGTTMPTKATALLREGRGVAIGRARDLIDLYCQALEATAFEAA